MSSRLPALDNLLLRAQGAYEQEKKKRQQSAIKWQWAAITIVAMCVFAFCLWLYVTERRADMRQTQVMDIRASVANLTESMDTTQEIIRELIARDIQREGHIQELRVLLRQKTALGKPTL